MADDFSLNNFIEGLINFDPNKRKIVEPSSQGGTPQNTAYDFGPSSDLPPMPSNLQTFAPGNNPKDAVNMPTMPIGGTQTPSMPLPPTAQPESGWRRVAAAFGHVFAPQPGDAWETKYSQAPGDVMNREKVAMFQGMTPEQKRATMFPKSLPMPMVNTPVGPMPANEAWHYIDKPPSITDTLNVAKFKEGMGEKATEESLRPGLGELMGMSPEERASKYPSGGTQESAIMQLLSPSERLTKDAMSFTKANKPDKAERVTETDWLAKAAKGDYEARAVIREIERHKKAVRDPRRDRFVTGNDAQGNMVIIDTDNPKAPPRIIAGVKKTMPKEDLFGTKGGYSWEGGKLVPNP